MQKPSTIDIHGARIHNLKNIDVSVPLGKFVCIAGVSGSGKSSLALGILFSEGSRRYLESLSTYTRRRLSQAAAPDIDSIENIPAAVALHQRPPVPNIRSTFGTSTELLNILRLIYSRLGNHRCPNGHMLEPSPNISLDKPLKCPQCGAEFWGPGAESLAFNSDGACEHCSGTGIVWEVNEEALIPNKSLTLAEGAVESWKIFGLSWMYKVAVQLGVRENVPYNQLSEEEKNIILHGPEVKKRVVLPSENGKVFDLNITYRNAYLAVQEALKKASSEKGLERIRRLLHLEKCAACNGTRLSEKARSTTVMGLNLAEASTMTLGELIEWVKKIPATMPANMQQMATTLINQLLRMAQRLVELGLDYLTLDRAGATLSTGERQRVQLARTVRNCNTGVLYILDEPTIGLHPRNIEGVLGIVRELIERGNSVVVVDHDIDVLRQSDWLIEIGPGAGRNGGQIIAQGRAGEIEKDKQSILGDFLAKRKDVSVRKPVDAQKLFEHGRIHLSTDAIHTVHPLEVDIPKGRMTVITGVSGSGKTTLILDSLVPALSASIEKKSWPAHVKNLDAPGIKKVHVIDSAPIGSNVRSTVATYSNILDDLRELYAAASKAGEQKYKSGDFSYNTGKLKCPVCDGTGEISMDVQFLPDISIVCQACGGSRYAPEADKILLKCGDAAGDSKGGAPEELSLPQLMALPVEEALKKMRPYKKVYEKLNLLNELGLGYLTLGEGTPALSGGEAQRLKLMAEIGKLQSDAVFVFDEPTIGLHVLDIKILLEVMQRLLASGATIIVIEHDLAVIKNADYVIDMGPGGGASGGKIVACGTLAEVACSEESITAKYLK